MKFIANTFILIFLLVSIKSSAQPKPGEIIDMVIGIVGNNTILKSDIENQYIQYKAQGLGENGDVKCQIFEDMLFQKLLITQADLDSIEIPDKELEAELDHRINMFISQIGSEEKLEQYYNKKIREIKAEFKDIIKDQLLAQKMQQKLTKDIKLTPSDIQKYFNSLSADSLPQLGSNTEIQQLVKYPKISEIEKQEILDKLEVLRKRVLAGEKFSTLAVLYSEDPGSAKSGGELGFVGRTDLVPEFAAAAFKLKEPNEISRVIETEYGYHVIQLIERKGERINVRHILMTPKVSFAESQKVAALMDSLFKIIKSDSLKMEDAVVTFSEDDKSKNNSGLMYNVANGTTKFEDEQIEPRTKLTIQDLKIDELSKPFETKDDKGRQVYKIVRVKSKVKAHTANLKDDYKEIQEMALGAERQRIIKEWITTKLNSTYIRIDDSFKNCKFNYGNWVK